MTSTPLTNVKVSDTDQNQYLVLPKRVLDRDGPFEELKQDASIISVETEDGTTYSAILLLYPHYIIGMKGHEELPFDPASITRAFQSQEDRETRWSPDWPLWKHPWSEK